MLKLLPAFAAATLLWACASPAALDRGNEARQQVIAVEQAFAKTMADRDLEAFSSFLSEEAVFFSGPTPLRGKQAIVASWSRFYAGSNAPFSWRPEEVEVLEGGSLALSAGPVHDAQGKLIGRFSSIWRQEAAGRWRIVFDRGQPACDCKP